MVYLQEDLIIKILLRLPVNSLLCFKCISKSWFSLISDSHFAISHFELAAVSTHRLLYLPCSAYASHTCSIDLNMSSSLHIASVPLNPSFMPPNGCFEIKGSCRGFVFLRNSFDNLYYIWNPSTSVYKLLPPSPVMLSNVYDWDKYLFLYGFGYDSLTDDYLVFLAYYNHYILVAEYFELFSLRANAWSKIEGIHFSYADMSEYTRAGTLLNETIHWLVAYYNVHNNVVIVAYDLAERIFSEMPLPNDFNPPFPFCDLCVLGGLLSLCVAQNDAVELWVMREYKVQSSWTRSIVVSLDDIPIDFFPACLTKSGDVVGMAGRIGLVKCNANGQLLERHSNCDDPYGCQAVMYRESLLSIPVDTEQAAE